MNPLATPDAYADLEPLLRRLVDLDPRSLVRLRHQPDRLVALVRTPFAVTASRALSVETELSTDVTFACADLLAWLEGGDQPGRRDEQWRWGIPPEHGWEHLDEVPGAVLRDLVQAGSRTLAEAAEREGVPGAQPRSEVVETLLDSVVLMVSAESMELSGSAKITLRSVSALVRLGFVESAARVAVCGRWIRVAGEYGSVFAESASAGLLGGLTLRPVR